VNASAPVSTRPWSLHRVGPLLAALVLSVAATPAMAQVLYGSIVGNVTDAQGAAVPGATVTIVNKETNLTREATADEEGNYSLVNVLPGSYDVKVSLQGFREFVRSNVPVSVSVISRVDVRLEVGSLAETVTVASEAQLLQTDKADVHTELKSAEITAMPLNQFRNYQALINLVPGATPANFQNAETDTPARSLTTNVNGQNRNSNATRTDGATNVNIWLPHHNMYISPAETIDTVNVSTNNFDAEQGMAGGAAITVITKSGTNQFKGSAFEFYNTDALNARPYFFGSAASKPDKLPVDRHIFGGTVGGPVRRNRVFFFGSYEGYKQSQNLTNFLSVPDARIKAGDFSQALNANGTLQIIYDPATGNPDGTGREPFPGNVIPASRITQIARQLLGLYPDPNTTGFGAGGFTNNFERSEKRTTTRHNYDTKVNWNRTAAHQIWGKFAYLDATVDDRTYFLGPDINAEGDGGITKVWQFTTGHTWTLSPTVIVDSTFGFSRQKQDVLGPDFAAGNFGLDVLGIPGTNDQGIGDDRYAGYPRFNTSYGTGVTTGTPPLTVAAPFTTLGNFEGWMPIFRDERTYSFATNVTKVKGAHEFRGGYLVNFLYLDHWQPELDNPRGCFDFSRAGVCTPDSGGSTSGVTSLRGGPQAANFYNFFAQFLLGLPSTVSKSVQYEDMTTREWQHGLYFRDRWTVTPKLTLDLGLRWEYYPIMHRADRGLERVDLQTLDVLLGGRGGNPDNVGLEAAKDNFAPRLGAIYRINDDTVVRTGYGITYNPIPWGRPLRGFYPATIAAAFFNTDPFQPYGSLAQGIPTITGPDLESGRFPLPGAVDMRTPEPGNVDRGTIQSWNLAFERRFPLNLALDIAYVGAKGDGGYADLDINAPQVIGSGAAGRPYAPMGRTIALRSWGQRLKTRYHALQLAVNRPFTGGLMLKGAYTWSKSMNMADDDGWVGLDWNTLSQIDRNYALAGFDRKHNFQLGFLYQLPWKSDGGYDNVARAVISDWQLNGVLGVFSGIPFNMSASSTEVNTPSNRQTPDQIGEARKIGEVGASGLFYDPSAWAQPTGVRFGTVGRNALRGPGGFNLDVSLFRSFPLGGTRRLEFRAEAFNLTNTPTFAVPNGDVTSPNFMRITAIQGGFSERNIRLGLRFSF
jgi:Carboxypeptidase regulatory-like domain/TonB dependent receptor